MDVVQVDLSERYSACKIKMCIDEQRKRIIITAAAICTSQHAT